MVFQDTKILVAEELGSDLTQAQERLLTAIITKFDNTVTSLVADETQTAIDKLWELTRPISCSVYASNPFSHQAPPGISPFIPFTNTEFETDSGIHDPTILDSGTATSATVSTLTDTSKSWSTNQFAGDYVKILTSGGNGQWRRITSNTATVLTLETNWTVTPSSSPTYEIINEDASKLIAPVAGIYRCTFQASHGSGTSLYGCLIYKNGTFTALYYENPNGVTETACRVTRLIELAQNDYIQAAVYQQEASNNAIFTGASRCFLQMERI